MARTVGIGIQSFEKLIMENSFYIDKTDFIRQWWENRDDVTLIARPRRFGKTLNMNMLERFLSIEYAGQGEVFMGLSIWEDEKYRNLQGIWPVISLSFADVKANTFGMAREKICMLIKEVYRKYGFLLAEGSLKEGESELFRRTLIEMTDSEAAYSLKNLSGYLAGYYGKKVIILLDEYDTPMQMIGDWFQKDPHIYNGFIRALLQGDEKAMNLYMNRVALTTFSYFDTGKHPSEAAEPERFYHGFVLGLMVDLAERYTITSNRESGFGRYDVILEPLSDTDNAIILEFKVHDPDEETSLADTAQEALDQIERMKYSASLEAKGIPKKRIRQYGFAFEGKTVFIG